MRIVKRSEIKHLSEKKNYNQIKNLLKNMNAIKLYPSRLISSIYFDNKHFNSYFDSEEGLVPRKKIRFRSYSKINSIKVSEIKKINFNFEIKIAKENYDEKISKKSYNTHELFKSGIFDNDLGHCVPIIKVSYFRDYFYLNSSIVTLDYNLVFSRILFNHFINLNSENIVVEFKHISKSINQNLFEKCGFKSIRFSKYSAAFSKIYL